MQSLSGRELFDYPSYSSSHCREKYNVSEGFQTERGELIRGIMYPKPIDSEFNRHAMRFLLFLAVLSIFGFIYSLYTQYYGFEAGLLSQSKNLTILYNTTQQGPKLFFHVIDITKSRLEANHLSITVDVHDHNPADAASRDDHWHLIRTAAFA